jgi:hypothetical protein
VRRLASLALTAGAVAIATAACGPVLPPQYVPGSAPGIAKIYNARTPNFAAFHSITNEHFASPAVGDFYGDGPVVAAGYSDGWVRFTNAATGALRWSFYTGAGAVQSSPVVVDLNKDGNLDVVVTNTLGDVWSVTPKTHATPFHVRIGNGTNNSGAFATPAVADINGDGVLDVVETGWDQYLHVWSSRWNGTRFPELPGFPLHLQDTSWSSPAVADVDKDGKPEIIFGYDCDGAPGQYCRTRFNSYGGFVTVIRNNGAIQPGWPRFVSHQVVWSTPAVADLNGDGWLDVVVGTGNMNATMYDGGKQPMDGGHVVNAYTGRNGAALPGWPVAISANATGSPVVADLDADGHKEVIEIGEDGRMYIMNSAGQVTALTCVADNFNGCPHWLHTTPSVADVNNDGRQEIVVGGEQWLDVYSYNRGALKLVNRGWPGNTYVYNAFAAAPLVTSVNGKATVIVSTDTPTGGRAGALLAWQYPNPLGGAAWPAFKHDVTRSGRG